VKPLFDRRGPIRGGLFASLLLAAGCTPAAEGAPPPSAPPPAAPTPATPSGPATDAPSQAPSAGATTPTEPKTPTAKAPSFPTVELRAWTQSHEAPVRSLGIGKRRIAVLGDSAWMRDGGKWREIAFPEELRPKEGADNQARIFFGRDDRPRLMGIYAGDPIEAVYFRYKGGWRKEPKEIGHLARKPTIPLFGILGHDDPEVVCKLGDQCIIKRLTGWTMVPAGDERLWVELSGTEAWGLGEHKLVKITNDGWKPHGGRAPFDKAGGVWGDAEGEVWVSEPATDRLHHFDGQTWSTHTSPIAEPRALWGTGPEDVWLVGEGGAAHYDGKAWAVVAGLEGPLREIRGAPDGTIWAAGASGTWMGKADDEAER
jgi:hypothetical protein